MKKALLGLLIISMATFISANQPERQLVAVQATRQPMTPAEQSFLQLVAPLVLADQKNAEFVAYCQSVAGAQDPLRCAVENLEV